MYREEDLRMSDDCTNFFDCVTNLDRTIVFLNLLADKMECDTYEFVFPDTEMRKRRVYRLLKKLDKQYSNSISVTCAYDYGAEGEYDEEEDYIIERLSLNQFMYLDIHVTDGDIPECHMEYYFNKFVRKDGSEKPIYTVSVTTKDDYFLSGKKQAFNYMFSGSDIISVTEGELADFFERTASSYLEHGGTKSNYLVW